MRMSKKLSSPCPKESTFNNMEVGSSLFVQIKEKKDTIPKGRQQQIYSSSRESWKIFFLLT